MTTMRKVFNKVFSGGHAKLYEMVGGDKMGGGEADGSVILVTTTGRKSGQPRTRPLMKLMDGDRYLVTGSAGGGDDHPDWILNMLANPDVEVRDVDRVIPCTAEVITDGPEREALFERFKALDDRFAGYEAKTTRKIPVVILTPKQ